MTDQDRQDPPRPRRRGFATLTPEQRREIARQGGLAAQAAGTAHQWTPEEARDAGRKGGRARRGEPLDPICPDPICPDPTAQTAAAVQAVLDAQAPDPSDG